MKLTKACIFDFGAVFGDLNLYPYEEKINKLQMKSICLSEVLDKYIYMIF